MDGAAGAGADRRGHRLAAVISEHRLQRRVQFHETDLAGIVHFSWFFLYMEEAEHALWRAAGLKIARPDEEAGYPRLATSFEFHAPLCFDEEFEVLIRIVAMNRKTMRYECLITRGETKIATGALTIACVRRRPGQLLEAVDLPADVRERLAPVG
jgi:YbgC/YbaW family acyl-CoA thioester hydrolase